MARRKRIDPAKARAAAGGGIGGWYERIPVVDTRPTCSRCGTRTYIVDQEHGECLRCQLIKRKGK